MTAKVSAGCLVRAVFDGEVRYLVVHPSGGYNRGALEIPVFAGAQHDYRFAV